MRAERCSLPHWAPPKSSRRPGPKLALSSPVFFIYSCPLPAQPEGSAQLQCPGCKAHTRAVAPPSFVLQFLYSVPCFPMLLGHTFCTTLSSEERKASGEHPLHSRTPTEACERDGQCHIHATREGTKAQRRPVPGDGAVSRAGLPVQVCSQCPPGVGCLPAWPGHSLLLHLAPVTTSASDCGLFANSLPRVCSLGFHPKLPRFLGQGSD